MTETTELYEGERIDDLQLEGLRIIQKKGTFCFGMDAVLLADFASCNSKKNVCDLGSGSGILSFLLHARYGFRHLDAVELQQDMAERSRRSVQLNRLEEKITVHNHDLRHIKTLLPHAGYDVVITNPPYSRSDASLPSSVETKKVSRQDHECTLEDTVSAAAWLLKCKGYLYMVYPAARTAELTECLHRHRLQVKVMRFVHTYTDSPARLVLLAAMKDGGPGVRIMAPLIAKDPDGEDTAEIKRIYHLAP